MFDFRRLRGTGVALLGVLLAIGACRLVLGAALGDWPRWLPKRDWTITRIRSLNAAGGRLAGIDRVGHAPDARFGALLGSSTISSSIDATILDSEVAPPLRWFHLDGTNATGDDLGQMADLLFRSRIKPEVLVVGVNLGMMAEAWDHSDYRLNDMTSFYQPPLRDDLSRGDLRRFVKDGKGMAFIGLSASLNRALPNRNRVNTCARYLALRSRIALFGALGIDPESIFSPTEDPWDMVPQLIENGHGGDECWIDAWMYGVRKRGWFDPAEYDAGGHHARSIADLVKRSRRLGITTVIVLLPEITRVRAAIPREANRVLNTALVAALGPVGADVIDLRDLLSDNLFYDPIHPGREGRDVASRRLARELRRRLKSVAARD